MASEITFDKNSHVFQTYMKNGTYNPVGDMIVYDGGSVTDEGPEDIYDGGSVTDE